MSHHPIETAGRKEVTESVLIAALITLFNGIINWGIDAAKKRVEKKATPPPASAQPQQQPVESAPTP